MRARIVGKAETWRWSSLHERLTPASDSALAASPLPSNWAALVQEPQTEAELAALRSSIQRGTPYGSRIWTRRGATQLGLEFTLRPRGRPRKTSKK